MANYTEEVLADSPEVFLLLTEAAGTTVYDASGNNRHGALTGTPTSTADVYAPSGRCFLFNGTTQYGSSASYTIGNDMSIEVWARKTSGTGHYSVVGISTTGNPLPLGIDTYGVGGNNKWRAVMTGNSGATTYLQVPDTATIVDGEWVHLIATYTHSTTTLRLYKNGVLVGSSNTTSGSKETGTHNLWVGRYNTSISQLFPGRLNGAAAYGSVLSDARVLAHYNAVRRGPTSSLTDVMIPELVVLNATAYYPMQALSVKDYFQGRTLAQFGSMGGAAVTGPAGGTAWDFTGGSLRASSDNLTGSDASSAPLFGCWLWTDAQAGDYGVWGSWLSNNGAIIHGAANGQISMSFGGSSITSGAASGHIKNGRWHLVAAYSAAGVSLFGKRVWVDGEVAASSGSTSSGGVVGAGGWELGSYANDASANLDGRIAHAFVCHPGAVSEATVQASLRKMYRLGSVGHIPHGLTVY